MYCVADQSEIEYSDLTYRRRLQVLQSVDDLVEELVGVLDKHGVLDNTYMYVVCVMRV